MLRCEYPQPQSCCSCAVRSHKGAACTTGVAGVTEPMRLQLLALCALGFAHPWALV